jgi:ferric-dicitrate binding protein FerR (iron transport regulator)
MEKVEIPYAKSKDDVWQQLSEQTREKPSRSITFWMPSRIISSVAAGLLILFSVITVMRFYTKSIHTPSGQHQTVELPDGSTVTLNANTTLTFHPYWWQFSRIVGFEGEGLFKVQEGKKFEVVSNAGRTVVLGTVFNIYNREWEYKVTCISGSVKVISSTKKEAILGPDYKAEIISGGDIIVSKESDVEKNISWVNRMFQFTSTPLVAVIKEIERQYNIRIKLNISEDYFYTGYFARSKEPEEVLDLLSKTFNFTIIKKSDREYEIIQKASE